jgi:hypothetical protein
VRTGKRDRSISVVAVLFGKSHTTASLERPVFRAHGGGERHALRRPCHIPEHHRPAPCATEFGSGWVRLPVIRFDMGVAWIMTFDIDQAAAFMQGAIMACAFLSSLFFLRFYKTTRDPLFAYLAGSFFLMGVIRVFLSFTPEESRTGLYWLRFVSFLLIIFAIIHKNRPPKSAKKTQPPITDSTRN